MSDAIGNVGYATLQVIPSMKGTQSNLAKALAGPLESTASKTGENIGQKMSAGLGKTLRRGTVAVAAAVGGLVSTAFYKGFQRLQAIDTAEKKMLGLGHTTESVKTIMDSALASVKGTAFGLGDAATVAASAVASGVKPGAQLTRTLKLVADAATIGGTSMSDMGLIFNKVAATGKIQGEVIAQLGERGIPILQLLGKEIGKTPQEVAKLASQGKIDFATFQNAMEKGLGGAALKSGETFTGALANVGAALGRLGAKMLSGVFPQTKGLFRDITATLDNLSPVADRVGVALGKAFSWAYSSAKTLMGGVSGIWSILAKGDYNGILAKTFGIEEDSRIVDVLFRIRDGVIQLWSGLSMGAATRAEFAGQMDGLVAIGAKVREMFDTVKNTLVNMSGSQLAGVGVTLGVIATKAGAITPFFKELLKPLSKLAPAFKFLTGPVGILTGLFVTAYTTSEPFRSAINGLLGVVGDLAQYLIASLVPVLGQLAEQLMPSFSGVMSTVVTAAAALLVQMTPLIAAVLPKLVDILVAVIPLVGSFIQFLLPMAPTILAIVGGVMVFTKVLAVARVAIAGVQSALAIARGVMLGARIAMLLLNMAFLANPVGLLIAGLVALGAGLVLLWNKSDTFRGIVTGAWTAIQGAAASVVSFFTDTVWPGLQGVFSAVSGAMQAVGSFFASVWSSITSAVSTAWGVVSTIFGAIVNYLVGVFQPVLNTYLAIWKMVFQMIEILVLAAWKLVIQPVFNWIVAGLQVVGGWFVSIYNSVIKPAWDALGAGIQWVYQKVIKPAWDALIVALRAVGSFFQWVYRSVIKPTWDALGSAIRWVWDNVVRPVFDAIKQGAGWVSDKFVSVKNGIVTAWNAIQAPMKAVWDYISSKVFDGMKTGLNLVKTAFEKTKDGIKTAWDMLKEIAKAPIKFVIGTVLNGGLIKGFNWLSSKIGGPHIDDIPLPFARGGVLPGWSPGRDIHQFYSPTGGRLALSGGEAIMRPEFTRQVGGNAGVARLNAMARAGTLKKGQAFADGGVFGWIKSKASSAFDWVREKSGDVWQAISNPGKFLMSKLPGFSVAKTIGQYGEATVTKLKDLAVDKVTGLWKSFRGAFDKVEEQRAGAPGALPPGATGFTMRPGVRLDQDTINRLVRAAASGPLHAIQGSWQNYHLSAGTHMGSGAVDLWANNWMGAVSAIRRQGMLAMFRNWPGNQHIHALNPNVSGLSPQALAQVATARRNGGNFNLGGVFSYDSGGLLQPGWTLAHNGTGKPEPVGHDLVKGGGQTRLHPDDIKALAAALREGSREGMTAAAAETARFNRRDDRARGGF